MQVKNKKENLHSTMVLFKLNAIGVNMIKSTPFTFHYGPIQMTKKLKYNHSGGKFTFHYGPIQIDYLTDERFDQANLHSTMVLFKLYRQFY